LAVKIQPGEFLDLAKKLPVIDVRAPLEYNAGHIPGAINIPLFTDEQRAIVGTTYKREGSKAAIISGLKLAGPDFAEKAKQAMKIATNGEILMHCWRGGMRSESMAWLFELVGIKVSLLEGGYKAYRTFIRKSWEQPLKAVILGGLTGSGKTEVIHEIRNRGHQVIDLEGIANHKGSAFGALGQPEQPTNEQFENDLYKAFSEINRKEIVWLEDESKSIGKVRLPDRLYEAMNECAQFRLDLPLEIRIKRIVKEYAYFDKEQLSEIINRISKKYGPNKVKTTIDLLQQENFNAVAEMLLEYYDHTYSHATSRRKCKEIYIINADSDVSGENAEKILESFKMNLK